MVSVMTVVDCFTECKAVLVLSVMKCFSF